MHCKLLDRTDRFSHMTRRPARELRPECCHLWLRPGGPRPSYASSLRSPSSGLTRRRWSATFAVDNLNCGGATRYETGPNSSKFFPNNFKMGLSKFAFCGRACHATQPETNQCARCPSLRPESGPIGKRAASPNPYRRSSSFGSRDAGGQSRG
jgi:hypothetical protein